MKSVNSQADAREPALPGAMRRPLQGEKALHVAKRSENDRGARQPHRGVPTKTLAFPLAFAFICLVVYASLYPFADWRDQGISPLTFLTAPWPQYLVGFDVAVNTLGYAPLGFLLALIGLRRSGAGLALALAVMSGALLSLCMETLQSYLPSRIPSNADWALNIIGTTLGACTAWALNALGVVSTWSRFKARWFARDASGAMALLLLWPVALLFPAPVPMGLGQVLERLEIALSEALGGTPFINWLPLRDIELQPLVPGVELLCVALGALIPCLLGYCVIRTARQRAVFSMLMLAVGVGASALSAALSYGPEHAWAWLDAPVRVGLWLAAVLALLMLPLPRRGAAAFALLALAIYLSLLNQAPASAYFAQTLQTWEQGRFIRFHGLAQWLGWLWPYAVLLYLLARLSAHSGTEDQ